MNEAGASPDVAEAAVMQNQDARVQGKDAALGVLPILGVASLPFTSRIPQVQPGSTEIKPVVA